MKTKKARGKPVTTRTLADNACPHCGSEMKETTGKLSFPINGEEIAVSDSPHLRCRKCDEVVLRLDEARRLRERALEFYRKKYGLLAGEEIRRLRERLALTQGQLAELLRLGVNTISRWESGRNVQTAAMDVLLRLVRDVPGSIEYLRKRVA
jgi:putative zinc finger/helix-turn-helix YgiT family protein